MRRAATAAAVVAALFATALPAALRAQVPPGAAVDTVRLDTLRMPRPRDVFIKSLLVPGWGQAELGAYTRGSIFFALQTTSIYMLLKTAFKLDRAIQSERGAIGVAVDSLRQVIATDTAAARRLSDPFTFEQAVGASRRVLDARALVRSRKRHRQDWITYLLFFTLLSGVDAYVGAHLADFPADISASPRSGGLDLRVTVPIGGR